jgi:adenosylhomocysteine nucleosidase
MIHPSPTDMPSSSALRFLALTIAAALFCAAPVARAKDLVPPPAPSILVMASFPEELASIEKMMALDESKAEITKINGITFKTAEIKGRRCVFFLTGMSMVNAAANTQLALDRFNVQAVFFTGIAGGVSPEFKPGDVIIPARWHHHSEAAYFNETAPGKYQLTDWYKQNYPNFGMIHPNDVTVIREGMDKFEQVASFPADEKLMEAAKKATEGMKPMKVGDRVCKVSYGGAGVSGPVFCDNAEYRKWVYNVWKADCLDMESTAIAQVCWQNKVPCLIVRGLSDLAGGQAGKNEEEIYLHAAADNSAAVLVAILQKYEPAAAVTVPAK